MRPGKISKRIKFRDVPDWFLGRYFLFTIPYGLFYIIGAGIGYSRTGNLFCLLGGGGVGVLFTLLGIVHTVDYYNGARIESWLVGIPFTISLFVSIIMTCIWALGGRFKSSAIIACVGWVAVVLYFYSIIKDFAGGATVRENTWYSPLRESAARGNTSLFDSNADSNFSTTSAPGVGIGLASLTDKRSRRSSAAASTGGNFGNYDETSSVGMGEAKAAHNKEEVPI